ncbi:MAG: NAD(+)/NADH kinase [Halobacteriales archaeon]|nr:NAD(+)/NADH kinase [Halobacteriales archaeon]
MELGIVAQKDNDRALDLAAELHEEFSQAGHDIYTDPNTAEAIGTDPTAIEAMGECRLVVSIGGDGTFLYTARYVGATPILGINLGEVGFLNPIRPEAARDRLREEIERIRNEGQPRFREVSRLTVTDEAATEWDLPPALNEVVVQGPQRGHGQGIDIEISVDGGVYTESRMDGVLVATPTGSTAYNLSEGGPLVHPAVEGLVITEMCAAEPMPSLAVPEDSVVSIRATDAEFAYLSSDGERRKVTTPLAVRIEVAANPARIAGPQGDFFEALGKLK